MLIIIIIIVISPSEVLFLISRVCNFVIMFVLCTHLTVPENGKADVMNHSEPTGNGSDRLDLLLLML